MVANEFAPELQATEWLNCDRPLTLAELRGKVVCIEAFQMLCPGCVSHGLPQAARIASTFSPDSVTVLGLHTVFEHHEAQGTKAALAAFLHEYQIPFPVGIDQPSDTGGLPKTMAAYAMQGTPTLIIVDRVGRKQHQHFGSMSDMAVGARIMNLLREPAAGATESAE